MRFLIATVVVVLVSFSTCDAGFVINIGGRELTGSGASDFARNDAVVLTFENYAANKVMLTMQASGTEGNPDWWWSKGKTILFNSGLAISSFAWFDDGNPNNVKAKKTDYAKNGQNFIQSTKFDVKVEFSVSGKNGSFYPPMYSKYILTGAGLSELSFSEANKETISYDGQPLDLSAAIHINNPDAGEESGWYGSTDGGGDNLLPVPEPTSIALWTLCCCVGLVIRRRKKSTSLAI
jgi:hypothetical protein